MKNVKTEEIFEEDENKEWEVERIIKERSKRRKNKKTGKMEHIKEYLVKWVGYKSPTWEPEENLEHSQELLKEFLLRQIMKKLKKEKQKIPQTPNIYRYEKTPTVTEYKILKKRKLTESLNGEEPSTFSNSLTNNVKKNKNKKNNKKNKNLSVLNEEEEEDMYYDIEIGDVDDQKSLKKVKNEINENEEKSLNSRNAFKKNGNKSINNKSKIINDEIDITELNQISHSIYLDDEDNIKKNNDTGENEDEDEDEKEDTSITNYLEKKRSSPNEGDVSDEKEKKENHHNNKDNEFKIIQIYSIKVPKDSNTGIILNVKYKKNNKIYIEEFNTKNGEMPNDCLVKYYDMIICELLKGQSIYKELSF